MMDWRSRGPHQQEFNAVGRQDIRFFSIAWNIFETSTKWAFKKVGEADKNEKNLFSSSRYEQSHFSLFF